MSVKRKPSRCTAPEMTKDDIALALGKVFGIMAVVDNGFMKAAAKKLTKVNYNEE